MYLSYRKADPKDLETCHAFVQARLGYPEKLKVDLLAYQRETLKSGSSFALVFEDKDRPQGRCVAGIAVGIFASDQFVREAKTTLPPFLPLRILSKWKKGEMAHLSGAAVKKAHAEGGVTVVPFHWGVDPLYQGEDFHKLIEFMAASYQEIQKGWRVKEFMEEVFGEFERDRLMTFGLKLVRDYREFRGKGSLGPSIGKGAPFLMSADLSKIREEGKRMETIAGQYAMMGPPRYGFKVGEQEVLRSALEGETDAAIARSLGLSLATVKKRWAGIYEKVEDVDPDLFEERLAGKQGTQKRRLVLRTLKDHKEELWPNRPKEGSAGPAGEKG
jgi:DNA-binding CsgD family transcriptional regulator